MNDICDWKSSCGHLVMDYLPTMIKKNIIGYKYGE